MPIHQTKQSIANHFIELSKTMMIDKITVQNLVDQAGISRQTFYYHFKDIIEVIEWIFKQNLDESLKNSLNATNSEAAFKIFVNNAYENRELMNQLRYSKNRIEVEDILINGFRSYLFQVIKKYPPKLNISFADMELALEYHTHGIIGLLLSQLNKNDVDPDGLALQMNRLAKEIHDFS